MKWIVTRKLEGYIRGYQEQEIEADTFDIVGDKLFLYKGEEKVAAFGFMEWSSIVPAEEGESA